MESMIFVRTRTTEIGRIRTNLANTNLKRGSLERPYNHKLSVNENHLVSARCWVLEKMCLVSPNPLGAQSFDDGYIFAFSTI